MSKKKVRRFFSLSHSDEKIERALARGEKVWRLSTGNKGCNDVLIGDRKEVMQDILVHLELASFPTEWKLREWEEY